jgi:TRAP-type C4-dicarboxylate transport system permease small subunit
MSKEQNGARRLAVFGDVCSLVGAGLIGYGAWLVYAPAGFITIGAMALVFGVGVARSRQGDD